MMTMAFYSSGLSLKKTSQMGLPNAPFIFQAERKRINHLDMNKEEMFEIYYTPLIKPESRNVRKQNHAYQRNR